MNMPQAASTSLHDPSTPAVVRLVDTAGRDGPATASEVAGYLQAGRFFWLDLEDPGDDELAEFSQSLQLPAGTIVSAVHASARSSFALAADSVRAVLPAAADTEPTAWLAANYVTVVLTERFLFTVHVAPCALRARWLSGRRVRSWVVICCDSGAGDAAALSAVVVAR